MKQRAPEPAPAQSPAVEAHVVGSSKLGAIDMLRGEGLLTNRYAPFIGHREIRCTVDDIELDDDGDPVYVASNDADRTVTLRMLVDMDQYQFTADMEGPGVDDLSDADWLRLLRQRLYGALLQFDGDLNRLERQAAPNPTA